MFKVGDEIAWVGRDGAHFSHGRIYIVLYAEEGRFIVRSNGGMDVARSQSEMERQFWVLQKPFVKVKLPAPKNDIEWLDRVQQNFKE